MGYAALLLLGAAAFGAMIALRIPSAIRWLVGAALMLGAAGYAWQGRPMLAAVTAKPVAEDVAIDPDAIVLRDALLGRFTADTAYIVAADAMTRSGDRDAAAQVTLGGVRKLPSSFILWTWLGVTLAARDADQVSPAALLAFNRAAQLAPEHPAPPFYAGLAYIRAGRFAEARRLWRRALALSPEGVSYRKDIALRLALLEQFLAMQAAGQGQR